MRLVSRKDHKPRFRRGAVDRLMLGFSIAGPPPASAGCSGRRSISGRPAGSRGGRRRSGRGSSPRRSLHAAPLETSSSCRESKELRVVCGFPHVQREHFCGRVAVPQVVIAEAVPSGRVEHRTPLWRDEGVGLVWVHEQIWNHKMLLCKTRVWSRQSSLSKQSGSGGGVGALVRSMHVFPK